MKRSILVAPLFALLLAAAPAAAQGRERADDVPPGYRPPPGMCRIWLDSVPSSQQPAPTDCASAVRNRPPNGRVIFGDEPRGSGRGGPKPKKLREPGKGRPELLRDDTPRVRAPAVWRTIDGEGARRGRRRPGL